MQSIKLLNFQPYMIKYQRKLIIPIIPAGKCTILIKIKGKKGATQIHTVSNFTYLSKILKVQIYEKPYKADE